MRIAVSYDNGEIFRHFGTSPSFKIYDCEDGKIVKTQIVKNNVRGHNPVIDMLTPYRIDAMVGMAVCASGTRRMEDMGIDVYTGETGDADAKVAEILAGKIEPDRIRRSKSDVSMVLGRR